MLFMTWFSQTTRLRVEIENTVGSLLSYLITSSCRLSHRLCMLLKVASQLSCL